MAANGLFAPEGPSTATRPGAVENRTRVLGPFKAALAAVNFVTLLVISASRWRQPSAGLFRQLSKTSSRFAAPCIARATAGTGSNVLTVPGSLSSASTGTRKVSLSQDAP